MTFEEQNKIREMLENVNKDYLLTLLITQMGQNYGYDYEKMLVATSEFLQAVSETESKYR